MHIEKINGRCCISMTPTEYGSGLILRSRAACSGCTKAAPYVKFTQSAARTVRLEIGTATYGRVYQTVAARPLLVGSRRWPDIKSTKGWIPSASEGQTFLHGVMSDETAIPISFDQETCDKQRDKRQDNCGEKVVAHGGARLSWACDCRIRNGQPSSDLNPRS